MLKCSYCAHEFSTKTSLNSHQKTAKYCLKIQATEGVEIKFLFKCEFCSKILSQQIDLDRHQLKCSSKKETDNNNKYELIINELEKKIIVKDRIIKKIRIECDKKLAEQKLIIEEQKLIIKDFQDEQRKQNKDLHDRIQCMAEKAIERTWETVVEIEQETDNIEEISNEPYELVPLELDNGYIIESRDEDGYINITNLCKAGGKEFKHWNSLGKTKAFLKALSTAVGIPTAILIQLGTGSKFGTTEETTGTWVHPQVAINIAQWISPQFDVKVSAWVFEVMITGKVDITNTKSYRELQQDNKNKQLKIQLMTKKYVKKQPRTQYDERNVVYILTTANMKKERRYILGKATNLTSRLSVYNKSDEHEVIYYQECLNEEKMGVVETLIFCKLNDYREQANRERFFLPEGEKLDLFIDTIKECIKFVK